MKVVNAAVALLCLAAISKGTPVSRKDGIPLDQVVFQLYTSKNPAGSRVVLGDVASLNNAGFDPQLQTKFLVHGWMDELQSGTIQTLKKALLALEPINVIGVGWSECAHVILYEKSVECSKQVGTYIGQMVLWLAETTGISPDDVHAIGHSLGAEAASFTSKVVRIGHITALDAAAPLFAHEGLDARLDAGDADFVDAFHTSISILGLKYAVGHVDFYPNGGSEQPGCSDIFGACAHGSAYHLYANTISKANREVYLAYKCDSVDQARNQTCSGEPRAVMGYGSSPATAGVYYLSVPTIP